jgi:hypothetical protein
VGSLMDGIEVSPTKQKAAASSSESTKTIKLVVAIVGLLVGGVLIAWNAGVFGSPEAATVDKSIAETPQATPAPVAAPRAPAPPPMIGAEAPQKP